MPCRRENYPLYTRTGPGPQPRGSMPNTRCTAGAFHHRRAPSPVCAVGRKAETDCKGAKPGADNIMRGDNQGNTLRTNTAPDPMHSFAAGLCPSPRRAGEGRGCQPRRPRCGGGGPQCGSAEWGEGKDAPRGRGFAQDDWTPRCHHIGRPAGTGVNHTEGQVFQHTIDLTKKRKRHKQPDRREKMAPAKAIAKKQPTKPAPSRTPEEVAAAEETRPRTQKPRGKRAGSTNTPGTEPRSAWSTGGATLRNRDRRPGCSASARTVASRRFPAYRGARSAPRPTGSPPGAATPNAGERPNSPAAPRYSARHGYAL